MFRQIKALTIVAELKVEGCEMEIFKVTIAVNQRDVEINVKAGVLASFESGYSVGGVDSPKDRVSVIVGEGSNGKSAWVQVAQHTENGKIVITNEGWIHEGQQAMVDPMVGQPINASITKVSNPTSEMTKCQEDAGFGILACCVDTGAGGCYVRCCNGCCRDPYGCPGASCCA